MFYVTEKESNTGVHGPHPSDCILKHSGEKQDEVKKMSKLCSGGREIVQTFNNGDNNACSSAHRDTKISRYAI